MKLTWYGTASVMLESGGCRIAADPFLTIPPQETFCRRKLHAVPYRTADAVLVTHGHFDHIYDIPRLYKNADVKICASRTPCMTLLEHGVDRKKLQLITPGIGFHLGGFTIRVYQGRHCLFDLGVMLKTVCKLDTLLHLKRLYELIRLNRKYKENGETLFYEIEAEGKRVQLMGSMGLDIDTVYPTGADALILPFQGTSCPARTVDPIIEKLKPKKIYLDHYDNSFPPMTAHINTLDFALEMNKKGIPTLALQTGKSYTI